ncbi:MAG TPA: exosortase-associated EpsI family protein [Methylomirabilota bacterium]|nr:exosortase-associated EpsI family protein [Methylomirabilota bacterium]
MTRQGKLALGLGLGVIGLAAVVLGRFQTLQRLGTPGLVMVARNVYCEDGRVLGTNSVALPEKVLDYQSEELKISTNVTVWLPADTTYAQRSYAAPDGFRILMNVVLMGTDRTSIHKPEFCLPGQGFRILKSEPETVPIARPHAYDLPVMRMTAAKELTLTSGQRVDARAVYVFWFVADGQLTADHNERMRWMARDLLTRGVLQRWAYVSCFAMCLPGEEDATYARVKQFISASVPAFQRATGPERSAGPARAAR